MAALYMDISLTLISSNCTGNGSAVLTGFTDDLGNIVLAIEETNHTTKNGQEKTDRQGSAAAVYIVNMRVAAGIPASEQQTFQK